jgi:hypothetical protein
MVTTYDTFGLDNFFVYLFPVYTDLILRWVFIGGRIYVNKLGIFAGKSSMTTDVEIVKSVEDGHNVIVLCHCKPVNRQKTTIFALILW